MHVNTTSIVSGKLPNKLPRKYKSLPDTNVEWCDHSENKKNGVFEDPLSSPAPDDTFIVSVES